MSKVKQTQSSAVNTSPVCNFMVFVEGSGHEWCATFGEAKARAIEIASTVGGRVVMLEVVGEAQPAKAAFTATVRK